MWKLIATGCAVVLVGLGIWQLLSALRSRDSGQRRNYVIVGFGAILAGGSRFLPVNSDAQAIVQLLGMVGVVYGVVQQGRARRGVPPAV